MRVHVRPYAILRQYLADPRSRTGTEMDLVEGSTVADAVQRLGVPPEKVMVSFVNGAQSSPAQVLREGDRLELLPPISGGQRL